jgi:hypothetical protein
MTGHPDHGLSSIDAHRLLELSTTDPAVPAIRTELLVATTDATLIITTDHPSLKDGTALMSQFAHKYGKPHHSLTFSARGEMAPADLQNARAWIAEICPKALNIGGPRESHSLLAGFPIGSAADSVMQKLFFGR